MEETTNFQKTKTRGNVIVNDIEIGHVHYEYDLGLGIKCKVVTKPKLVDGNWKWESQNLTTGRLIEYVVMDANEKDGKSWNSQFAVKLYDYEAYTVKQYI